MTSLCPPVRELKPGERPNGWASDTGDFESAETGYTRKNDDRADDGTISDPFSAAPARHELPPITGPQQYQMQFCITEEHVKLVERAKAEEETSDES